LSQRDLIAVIVGSFLRGDRFRVDFFRVDRLRVDFFRVDRLRVDFFGVTGSRSQVGP